MRLWAAIRPWDADQLYRASTTGTHGVVHTAPTVSLGGELHRVASRPDTLTHTRTQSTCYLSLVAIRVARKKSRAHSLQLPEHKTQLSDCNFLIRLLYKNTYWLLFLRMFPTVVGLRYVMPILINEHLIWFDTHTHTDLTKPTYMYVRPPSIIIIHFYAP